MRFDKLFLERALGDWQDMPNAEWLEIVQNKLESSLGWERFIELCNSNKKMIIKFEENYDPEQVMQQVVKACKKVEPDCEIHVK